MFIIGASTLGEMILDVAERSGQVIEGFYDDVTLERFCRAVPILGKIADIAGNPAVVEKGVFVAIGDNRNRRLCSKRMRGLGVPLCNVIDPQALIESSSSLGHGNLVMAGAYIGTKTMVGSGNLIFPGVSITHHNCVGDFCFFGPNCSVGGFTQINDECKIGMNCVVQPYRRIKAGTVTEPLTVLAGEPLSKC